MTTFTIPTAEDLATALVSEISKQSRTVDSLTRSVARLASEGDARLLASRVTDLAAAQGALKSLVEVYESATGLTLHADTLDALAQHLDVRGHFSRVGV